MFSGSVTQRFLPVSIAGIEPATFRNQRMEEWLFDCAQLGGIRRYFTFDFVKIHLKAVLVKLVLKIFLIRSLLRLFLFDQ